MSSARTHFSTNRRPASRRACMPLPAVWASALLAVLVSAATAAGQETVLFSTDLESNDAGLVSSGAVNQWEWGTPVFGDDVTPHSGSRVWGTNLSGRLAFYHDGSLVSPRFDLPSISASQKIYVSFYALVKLDCMSDRGVFYVSHDSQTWDKLADLFNTMEMGLDAAGQPRESGHPEWKRYVFDVSSYAGGPFYFRFQAIEPEGEDNWYECPPHDMAGMYVDDIAITRFDGAARRVAFTLEGWEDPYDTASCPWLLCWDGTRWEKENDIYSTARYPRGEFRDYLQVENGELLPRDGCYQIRIREIDEEELAYRHGRPSRRRSSSRNEDRL